MIKRGYLSYYDRCFLEIFNSWKVCYVVLCNNSYFEWYLDGRNSEVTGRIKLNKVFKYIAVGQICNRVPNRPDLPNDISLDLMIGIPHFNSMNSNEMEYFHFSDNEDLMLWMRIIESVIPIHLETSSNNLISNNKQSLNMDFQHRTNNTKPNEPEMDTQKYYMDNNLQRSYYSSDLGVATGLGFALGATMTMPMWAMSSAWCQPAIIHAGMPLVGDMSCHTNMVTTSSEIPTTYTLDYETNFNTDFGTTFTF